MKLIGIRKDELKIYKNILCSDDFSCDFNGKWYVNENALFYYMEVKIQIEKMTKTLKFRTRGKNG